LAGAISFLGAAANAAVTTSLMNVTPGPGGTFIFNYQGTLDGDAGLSATQPSLGGAPGSRLVIFDFNGYVPGSIFTPSANLLGTVENVSTGLLTIPGTFDDPNIPNLVFTWIGPDVQTSGGPYPNI